MIATIVSMRAEHIDALMPFEQEMFGTEAWTVSAYRTELADTEHRHYLVAEDGAGALIGWAGVLVIADSAEIVTIGTVPAARRSGVARALLDGLLDEARRRGASEVFLEVRVDNDSARAFYLADGFAEIAIRRGYYDLGRVDAVVMRREL